MYSEPNAISHHSRQTGVRVQRALTYGSAGELLLVFLLTITIAAVMLTQVRRPSAVVE